MLLSDILLALRVYISAKLMKSDGNSRAVVTLFHKIT